MNTAVVVHSWSVQLYLVPIATTGTSSNTLNWTSTITMCTYILKYSVCVVRHLGSGGDQVFDKLMTELGSNLLRLETNGPILL